MEFYEEIETVINNEKDYSNIVPTAENIAYLVQYCEQMYIHFLKLIEEDEFKNQKLKYGLQCYEYKKSFDERFEVIIREKNYNSITCKSYAAYVEIYNNGKLKNIDGIEVYLEMNYSKGKNDNLVAHENSFIIKFKPYEITFTRKSNFKEFNMDQIETGINEILNKFPVANTIFCAK